MALNPALPIVRPAMPKHPTIHGTDHKRQWRDRGSAAAPSRRWRRCTWPRQSTPHGCGSLLRASDCVTRERSANTVARALGPRRFLVGKESQSLDSALGSVPSSLARSPYPKRVEVTPSPKGKVALGSAVAPHPQAVSRPIFRPVWRHGPATRSTLPARLNAPANLRLAHPAAAGGRRGGARCRRQWQVQAPPRRPSRARY